MYTHSARQLSRVIVDNAMMHHSRLTVPRILSQASFADLCPADGKPPSSAYASSSEAPSSFGHNHDPDTDHHTHTDHRHLCLVLVLHATKVMPHGHFFTFWRFTVLCLHLTLIEIAVLNSKPVASFNLGKNGPTQTRCNCNYRQARLKCLKLRPWYVSPFQLR